MNTAIDWKLFEKILAHCDLDKMTVLEVVKRVYESTYMYHALKLQEVIKEREHVTERMVEKVQQIEDLQKEVAELRARLPEEGEEGTDENPSVLALHEGGGGVEGDS